MLLGTWDLGSSLEQREKRYILGFGIFAVISTLFEFWNHLWNTERLDISWTLESSRLSPRCLSLEIFFGTERERERDEIKLGV